MIEGSIRLADLSVDISRIRASAASVRTLCGELKGTRDAVDQHRSAIHHERLSDALEEFSSNWNGRIWND